ncbi:MAG: hypothetical protein BJ554DRAFT_1108, partial [Olpidium bornovanus]
MSQTRRAARDRHVFLPVHELHVLRVLACKRDNPPGELHLSLFATRADNSNALSVAPGFPLVFRRTARRPDRRSVLVSPSKRFCRLPVFRGRNSGFDMGVQDQLAPYRRGGILRRDRHVYGVERLLENVAGSPVDRVLRIQRSGSDDIFPYADCASLAETGGTLADREPETFNARLPVGLYRICFGSDHNPDYFFFRFLFVIGVICVAAIFFAIGQVIYFALSTVICEAGSHYFDGLFFGNLCVLLA